MLPKLVSRHFLFPLFPLAATAILLAACDDSAVVDTQPAPKATAQQAGGGSGGGSQKTFRIADLRQLEQLANKNPDAHFVQIKDLKGKQNAPIGSAATPFTGIYDGNGYEISGLTIKRTGESAVGLFAVTDGAELKNITLKNVDVRAQSQVGALVGVNDGTITDSEATGVVTANGQGSFIGGLVGENKGTITESSSDATVNGDKANSSDAGGLAGVNRRGGEITGSSATGDVQGRIEIGGLVGTNEGLVRASFATGDAETRDFTVGGLVGVNRGGTVTESFAEGDATSINDGTAGGLVGLNTTDGTSGGTISDSYATGTVTGVAQPNGGVVGGNLEGTNDRSLWETSRAEWPGDLLARTKTRSVEATGMRTSAAKQTGSAQTREKLP